MRFGRAARLGLYNIKYKYHADYDYFYRMTGELSLENNGGFIQFRTKIKNHPKNKSFKGKLICPYLLEKQLL